MAMVYRYGSAAVGRRDERARSGELPRTAPYGRSGPRQRVDAPAKSVQTELDDPAPETFPPFSEPKSVRADVRPETPADDAGADEPRPNPPLASEIEEALKAAIAKCVDVRPSFFSRVNETGRSLAPAFELLTLMHLGGDPVIDRVIADPNFPSRDRAPQRGNLALIAMHLSIQPKEEKQRSWCSEWANLLIKAAYEGVQPEDFGDWAAGVKLKECKAEVRKWRKQQKEKEKVSTEPKAEESEAKASASKEPDVERPEVAEAALDEESKDSQPATAEEPLPRLELQLLSSDGTVARQSLAVPASVYASVLLCMQNHSPEVGTEHLFYAISQAIRDEESWKENDDVIPF